MTEKDTKTKKQRHDCKIGKKLQEKYETLRQKDRDEKKIDQLKYRETEREKYA